MNKNSLGLFGCFLLGCALVALNIRVLGGQSNSVPVYMSGGYADGCTLVYSNAAIGFTCSAPPSGGVPAGSILLVNSGTCPSGFTEVAALNGVALRGTVAANKDVGTSTGSDSATPTTSSISLTAAAQAFVGNASADVVNHAHTLATGTGASGNFSQVIGTVDTTSGGTGATPTQTTLGTRTVATVGGVASYTPAGTNGTSTVTGTITMNSVATVPSSIRVIFCSKD